MGALYETPPPLHDLKVTLLRSTTIHPKERKERRLMFLSNIDKVLNFEVETVDFFVANSEFPPEAVVEKLRSALEEALTQYDFLAGRLCSDQKENGRLAIDCNAAGLELIAAASELNLKEIGDLEYPNPAFGQLVPRTGRPENEEIKRGVGEQPLIAFQVTSFKCGGFAVGITNNHITFDGISFLAFLRNLAALAASLPLPSPPFTDRRLLSARSPPLVAFPHPELLPFPTTTTATATTTTTLFSSPSSHRLSFYLFRLRPAHIATLKSKAAAAAAAATSFSVVAAHLWRCKALSATSSAACKEEDEEYTLGYAVDVRGRLVPPLPSAYAGNAVVGARASAPRRELGEEGSAAFARLVGRVRGAAERVTDSYARSAVDWGELHEGAPRADVFISSWWRLGFGDVEYPWGRPLYTCPVVGPQRDVVLLFPVLGGVEKGVNVLVALPPEDADKFRSLFYDFLAEDILTN
ncbi:omega-hydroxypalmitate O-feruloyl transferase [Ananas comosus]|uniref:Omega-hydroxypalmitate O-feruloyl transferase n=1 Tax=Ananas comosus TaxID=4615 RepID=A0A6P5FCS7_ANACO|nr:omega-hydroxypalmitate O-feruloyl transferase [Ananas comosus]